MSARDVLIAEELAACERALAGWQEIGALCVDHELRDRLEADQERGAIVLEGASPGTGLAGLVSTLTSGKRVGEPTVPFRVVADAAEARRTLDAFVLDPNARRLSKLRMNVGFAARAHIGQRRGFRPDRVVMVTLTYATDTWQPRHVADFIAHVRKHMQRRKEQLRYVWVAELQRRGVIHYHFAIWLPHALRLPKPDHRGWWPHGATRIEVARNAVPYLLKYLSKDTSKTLGRFPKGARVYGVGGLEHSMRRARRWLNLPSFVQGNSSIEDDWRRVKGGGWCDPHGVFWPSEFERVKVNDAWCCRRVFRHPRCMPDGIGPFSWIAHAKH